MALTDYDELYPYKGDLKWLKGRTILLVTHGSHAYGTAIETSDVDVKGVAVPPSEYFTGFSKTFEQAVQKAPHPDLVVYDIRKFFQKAAECNPNFLETIWVDEDDIRIVTPAGRLLLDARESFLSKKVRHTFSGYAHSQLKRIQGHYRWMRDPPASPPTRKDLKLPERTVIPQNQLEAAQSAVNKKLLEWELKDLSGVEPAERIRLQNAMAEMVAEMRLTADEKYLAAARSIGISDNFLQLLDLERQYKSKQEEWRQYQGWLSSRNPARFTLESKHGYDTKHALHLVRLMRMAREILETGRVIVKRPDRDELLAIRNGVWTYDQLIEWAAAQDAALNEIYIASKLPYSVDVAKLDQLCQTICGRLVPGYYQ